MEQAHLETQIGSFPHVGIAQARERALAHRKELTRVTAAAARRPSGSGRDIQLGLIDPVIPFWVAS
jgi:hypothetical protein